MYFLKKNNERSLLDEFSNLFTGNLFSKELKTDIEGKESKWAATREQKAWAFVPVTANSTVLALSCLLINNPFQ